jgi:hypothetical protein
MKFEAFAAKLASQNLHLMASKGGQCSKNKDLTSMVFDKAKRTLQANLAQQFIETVAVLRASNAF